MLAIVRGSTQPWQQQYDGIGVLRAWKYSYVVSKITTLECKDQRSLYFNNVLFRGHLRPLSITSGGVCSQTPSDSYNVTCLLFFPTLRQRCLVWYIPQSTRAHESGWASKMRIREEHVWSHRLVVTNHVTSMCESGRTWLEGWHISAASTQALTPHIQNTGVV